MAYVFISKQIKHIIHTTILHAIIKRNDITNMNKITVAE